MVASLAASKAPAMLENGAPFFCDFFLPAFALLPVSALLAIVPSSFPIAKIARHATCVKHSAQCEQLQINISELRTSHCNA
jgi:hypothetical protein